MIHLLGKTSVTFIFIFVLLNLCLTGVYERPKDLLLLFKLTTFKIIVLNIFTSRYTKIYESKDFSICNFDTYFTHRVYPQSEAIILKFLYFYIRAVVSLSFHLKSISISMSKYSSTTTCSTASISSTVHIKARVSKEYVLQAKKHPNLPKRF